MKKCRNRSNNGQEFFVFPADQDPANILGITNFHFDNFRFGDSVGFQICRFPDAAAGRTLRSQPNPSPNAPRDQIRGKETRAIAATLLT